ncbi:MAG: hypothetical protein ACPGJV_01695 [Bacteriovoracaceae bacterium]
MKAYLKVSSRIFLSLFLAFSVYAEEEKSDHDLYLEKINLYATEILKSSDLRDESLSYPPASDFQKRYQEELNSHAITDVPKLSERFKISITGYGECFFDNSSFNIYSDKNISKGIYKSLKRQVESIADFLHSFAKSTMTEKYGLYFVNSVEICADFESELESPQISYSSGTLRLTLPYDPAAFLWTNFPSVTTLSAQDLLDEWNSGIAITGSLPEEMDSLKLKIGASVLWKLVNPIGEFQRRLRQSLHNNAREKRETLQRVDYKNESHMSDIRSALKGKYIELNEKLDLQFDPSSVDEMTSEDIESVMSLWVKNLNSNDTTYEATSALVRSMTQADDTTYDLDQSGANINVANYKRVGVVANLAHSQYYQQLLHIVPNKKNFTIKQTAPEEKAKFSTWFGGELGAGLLGGLVGKIGGEANVNIFLVDDVNVHANLYIADTVQSVALIKAVKEFNNDLF